MFTAGSWSLGGIFSMAVSGFEFYVIPAVDGASSCMKKNHHIHNCSLGHVNSNGSAVPRPAGAGAGGHAPPST